MFSSDLQILSAHRRTPHSHPPEVSKIERMRLVSRALTMTVDPTMTPSDIARAVVSEAGDSMRDREPKLYDNMVKCIKGYIKRNDSDTSKETAAAADPE